MLESLVLGAGFTGSRFLASEENSIGTSHVEGGDCLYFDLAVRSSWGNLPTCPKKVFITFKMLDLSLVEDFYRDYLCEAEQIVVLGSAAVYRVDFSGQEITECSAVDFKKHARALCEDFLESRGAVILQSSLIWGYERSFEKWLRSGRIKNGLKLVNLIHVDDIVKLVQLCFAQNLRSERLLLSDGQVLAWQDLADLFSLSLASEEPGLESKVVSHKKLLGFFPDFEFMKAY